MKKGCLRPGRLTVTPGEKRNEAGAGLLVGTDASKKTPTSELMGTLFDAMPFSAACVWSGPPSGDKPMGGPPWSVLPETSKDRTVPGITGWARTGDSAGAESPPQAALPFGIPASQGFAVPGTEKLVE